MKSSCEDGNSGETYFQANVRGNYCYDKLTGRPLLVVFTEESNTIKMTHPNGWGFDTTYITLVCSHSALFV